MEFKLNIKFKELLSLIHQLPEKELKMLKNELDLIAKESTKDDNNDLENLIVNGPVMSDEEYIEFQDNRNYMNQWRVN